MNKDTILIIPAYNEEKNIKTVMGSLISSGAASKMDILVINDGSKDKTLEELSGFKEIKVISQVFNIGYGAALQTGYKYAFDNNYSYLLQMDADGQHDLSNLDVMLQMIKKENAADIIIGSRFLNGSVTFPISFLKKIAIAFFKYLIHAETGYKITDPTSGLQALNRKAFGQYAQYGQFDIVYPDINMILQMIYEGYKIEEFPAVMHERSAGVSMHSGLFKALIYMLTMFVAVIRISRQHPKKSRIKTAK